VIATVLLAACGGFLVAVLWMDLMFDVLVLRSRRGDVPEDVLAQIAAYYRRVITEARPMGHAVGATMAVLLVTLAAQIATGTGSRALALASVPLCAVPIALAALRVVPNAVRLGARRDPAPIQSALARGICRDHLVCLAGMLGFVALQLVAVAR
jgi:hypothetical protein